MAAATESMQDVYSKWESKNPFQRKQQGRSISRSQSDVTSSAVGREAWRNKFGNVGPPPQRHQKSRYRNTRGNAPSLLNLDNSSQIAQFKSSPSDGMTVVPRPFRSRCCSCTPVSRADLYNDKMESVGLRDILQVSTQYSHNRYLVRRFSHISFTLQAKIGFKYPDVSLAVLTSPRIVEAIQQVASRPQTPRGGTQPRQVEAATKKRVRGLVKRMKAEISVTMTRFTLWFLHKLFGHLLTSLVVHKGSVEMLTKASKRNLPIVFLPTHRSHLDYILITFILVNLGLRSPHIAAGENLQIPFFSMLMRKLGGFFIRRKIDPDGDKDILYRALLHSYMEELLKNREYFEFFLEGGRTRSGKAMYPKGGLLSVIADAVNQGVVPDVYIVPVGISYDKIVDGNFSNEQMGGAKVSESFWRAWKAIWRVIHADYGIARVDFSQPFSLKEYLSVSHSSQTSLSRRCSQSGMDSSSPRSSSPSSAMLIDSPSDLSLFNGDVGNTEVSRKTVQLLADHIIYTCTQCQAVMSTQLLSFLFLTRFREGVEFTALVTAVDWLREEIAQRGRNMGFTGSSHHTIQHAAKLLGETLVSAYKPDGQPCAIEEVDTAGCRLVPSTDLPSVFELAYYSNAVHPVFAMESAMACAVYSLVDPERWLTTKTEDSIYISQETLFRQTIDLCTLLKYEFIFKKPCVTMESALSETLDKLMGSEILKREEDVEVDLDSRDRDWVKRFSTSLAAENGSDDEWDQAPDCVYVVNKDSDYGRERLGWLCAVLGPVLEAYYIMSCSLTLLQEQDMAENVFCKRVHSTLLNRVESGLACYSECSSLDTVRNGVKGLISQGMLETYTVGKERMLGLHYRYKVEENLHEFMETLERYRPQTVNTH